MNSFRKSALVVEEATGEEPPVDDLPPETASRLAEVREMKQREFFISTFQWNKALSGLTEASIRQARWRPVIEGGVPKCTSE